MEFRFKWIAHNDIQYKGFITKNLWMLISDKKKDSTESYRLSQTDAVIIVFGLIYNYDF